MPSTTEESVIAGPGDSDSPVSVADRQSARYSSTSALKADSAGVPEARSRSLSPRWVFWLTFILLFFVTGLWSVAGPLMSALDEPAHTVKAAAVIRGELLADEPADTPGRGLVQVPELFDQTITLPNCFVFNNEMTAACQPELSGDLGVETEALTTAARYNPIFYALVGIPSLFSSSELTLYLMRLVVALLTSLMAALTIRTVTELGRSHWVMLGTVVSITPMVIFLSASVNPQSVEIAGALLVWVGMLAVLREPDKALLGRRLARVTLGAMFFANARGLGPFFLAMVLIAVVLCSPWRNLLIVVKDRTSWLWIGLSGAAVAFALGWILYAGSLDSTGAVVFPELVGKNVLKQTIDATSDYIRQTIGVFGWQDTPMPYWTYLIGAAILLFVVFIAMATGRFVDRLVMLGLAAVVLIFPLVSHYLQARYIGVFWQGRYILPLAIGVPLLAGFAILGPGRQIPLWINRRILGSLLLSVAGLQAFAFTINLHRYVNGWSGGWFRTDARTWFPPIHPLLLVGLSVLGWLLMAGVCYLGANYVAPPKPATASVDSSDDHPTAVLDLPPEQQDLAENAGAATDLIKDRHGENLS